MQTSGLAFGALGPLEGALILIAVNLMFGATKLGLVTPHSIRTFLREREFFVPPLLLGSAAGASLSLHSAPQPTALWGALVIVVGGILGGLAAHTWRARRYPIDLQTITVFLLAWAAVNAIMGMVRSPL